MTAGLHDEWYDFVYEDFQAICGIFGITLATDPVKLVGGGIREKPRIFFQLSWSQGDGASHFGTYRHARGAPKAIRAHAPRDRELHRTSDAAVDEILAANEFAFTADGKRFG